MRYLPFFGLLLLSSISTVAVAEEDAAKQKAACQAAIAEDDKRDEPKLTDEYRKKCADLVVQAAPLQNVQQGSGTSNEQMPEAQGLDLTPEQDAAATERGAEIARQTELDNAARAWQQQQQERRATMTPEQQAQDIEMQRRSFSTMATMARLEKMQTAETQITMSANEARYANQAAAVETYQQLAAKSELTPDEQITQQTMAAMAGEHAGRTARESGFQSEATQAALANDPIFADAYKRGQEVPPEQAGVGGYFGQFTTAEPRIMENHVRGTCGQAIGNVPALPCGDITSGFGAGRERPVYSPWHNGQDTRAPRGAPIMGSAIGTVRDVKLEGANRVSVHVDHGNGFTTVHRHVMAGSAPAVGTAVDTNTQIGRVETAGTGPHKHTEIFYNGVALNTNNYNQVAYTDRCTVGCPAEQSQPTVVASERIHSSPQMASSLGGTPTNGTNPTTYAAVGGGLRTGTDTGLSNVDTSGGLRSGSSSGVIQLAGGQRYTPGQGGMGDGGFSDTAPTMSPPMGGGGGGVSSGSSAPNAGGSLNQNTLPVYMLAQQTAQPLGEAQCKELLSKQMRASDLLQAHPECGQFLGRL